MIVDCRQNNINRNNCYLRTLVFNSYCMSGRIREEQFNKIFQLVTWLSWHASFITFSVAYLRIYLSLFNYISKSFPVCTIDVRNVIFLLNFYWIGSFVIVSLRIVCHRLSCDQLAMSSSKLFLQIKKTIYSTSTSHLPICYDFLFYL